MRCSLVLVLCCVACGPPHVELSAPAKSAPPETRVAAYEKLRARSSLELLGGPRSEMPSSLLRTAESLELGSGKRVYHASDLLPVVADGTVAAREAELESSRNTAATILTVAGAALLVAGTVVAVAPFFTTPDDQALPTQPIFMGAGLAVLSIPAFLFAGERSRRAGEARANAFEHYESALKRRLDVCGHQQVISACSPGEGRR